MIGIVAVVIIVAGLFLFGQKQYQPSQQSQQPTQQPQAKVEENIIIVKDFSFSPDVLTVKQGTKVTWVNQDSVIHNIKSDTFNSADLNQGDKFEFTFNSKGSFDYICDLHPSMKGKIIVE
ncbi:MAG: cupredoxin family copper-binding protein [bacterium]|nr:cupredoxin family copper-binding protein [bacterium]